MHSPSRYPAKPVQIIIPAAAGNSPDVADAPRRGPPDAACGSSRSLIINRPGAGGLIAAQAAARRRRDGYTLYMTQASTYTVLPVAQQKLPFDLERDFVPISLVGVQPIAVAVRALARVQDPARADRADPKETPGGMLFAASNRGGQSHLTGELFRARTGLNLTFVHAHGRRLLAQRCHHRAHPDHVRGHRRHWRRDPGRHADAARHRVGASGSSNYPDLPTVSETIPGFRLQGMARPDGPGRHAGQHRAARSMPTCASCWRSRT